MTIFNEINYVRLRKWEIIHATPADRNVWFGWKPAGGFQDEYKLCGNLKMVAAIHCQWKWCSFRYLWWRWIQARNFFIFFALLLLQLPFAPEMVRCTWQVVKVTAVLIWALPCTMVVRSKNCYTKHATYFTNLVHQEFIFESLLTVRNSIFKILCFLNQTLSLPTFSLVCHDKRVFQLKTISRKIICYFHYVHSTLHIFSCVALFDLLLHFFSTSEIRCRCWPCTKEIIYI